jgi:energy-coupling factor transporter ATP-binding protein EcfA2
MASLNKLAIRGIRSFDDKQISVIEFFSPVTVIVGHNGSGKTTIIECLKYATTGDQPPNTRGGAFVHDPKMANEKEVKAQVKLRFHAANGNRMLAVRNLSVTVKKTAGLTMKTLESILALADGNTDKGGKVCSWVLAHNVFHLTLLQTERSHLHKMRWDGCWDSDLARCIEIRPWKCHFLPPRGFVLAPGRTSGSQKEIWRYIRSHKVSFHLVDAAPKLYRLYKF